MKRPVRTISEDACRVYVWLLDHDSHDRHDAAKAFPALGPNRVNAALRRLVAIRMAGNYGGRYRPFAYAGQNDPDFPEQNELHDFLIGFSTGGAARCSTMGDALCP